jgi:hypothetical protein
MYRSPVLVKPAFGVIFCFLFFLLPFQTTAQTSLRSFDEIFTKIEESRKKEVFSPEGCIRSVNKKEELELIPAWDSCIDILTPILETRPSYLVESMLLIPYQERALGKLDAYNALQKVSGLKGRLYRSHTRNAEVPLFEEATRLESEKKTNPIVDPPPALALPLTETVFMRLKDVNFGNSYYRGDLRASPYGITYTLTNYRNLSYLMFTVIKAGSFTAVLYMEPLAEGMLVYSIAGAEATNFIAGMVDIPSAISKRLAVFTGWIADGLEAAK